MQIRRDRSHEVILRHSQLSLPGVENAHWARATCTRVCRGASIFRQHHGEPQSFQQF